MRERSHVAIRVNVTEQEPEQELMKGRIEGDSQKAELEGFV